MPHGKVAVNAAAWLRNRRWPDLGGLGGGLGVGYRARQLGGVGGGDRYIQGEQADPGAAGFLVRGLAGPGVVVDVAGGDVAAGAAGVLVPELSRPYLVVQGPGRRRSEQWPVLQGHPLGVGTGRPGRQASTSGDVLPRRCHARHQVPLSCR
jgi:hypothetical protein